MQASDLGVRASAALVAIGQAEWCDSGSYDYRAFFEVYAARAPVETAVLSEAFRITRVPLAGLLLILGHETAQPVARINDDVAPVAWNGPIPTFAMDQYTRSGKTVIRQFVQQSAIWNRFCKHWHIQKPNHIAAAAELLFRIDGAAVTSRALSRQSADLRNRSEILGCFMPVGAVHDAASVIRLQLPLIDKMRSSFKLT